MKPLSCEAGRSVGTPRRALEQGRKAVSPHGWLVTLVLCWLVFPRAAWAVSELLFGEGEGNVYTTSFCLGFFFVCFCARECELLDIRQWQFSQHGRKRNPSWAVAHPPPCSSRR